MLFRTLIREASNGDIGRL